MALSKRSTFAVSSPEKPGRISALLTRETLLPNFPTASVARLTTANTSSHSPSMVVKPGLADDPDGGGHGVVDGRVAAGLGEGRICRNSGRGD